MSEQVNVTGEVNTKKEEITKKDRLLIIIAAVIGFLFCEFIAFEGLGLGVPLFIAIFYAGAIFYLKRKDEKFSRAGLLMFIPVVILSLCFAVFSNEFLMGFNVLILFTLMIIHFIYLTSNNIYEKFSPGIFAEFVQGLFIFPFAGIGKIFSTIDSMGRNSKTKKTLLQVIIGLVIAIPVLAIVTALLVSSDAVFEKLTTNFFRFLNQSIMEYVGKIIVGIIFAFPIFSYMYSLAHKNKYLTAEKNPPKPEFVSPATVNTFLVLINLVYLTYIIIQFGYMFNAFRNYLPEGFNNSTYARRGFFELCAVCFINATIFFASYLFSKKQDGKLPLSMKVMFTALSVNTFIMITSAFSKMAFYIKSYGLTPNRIYPSWFMLLLVIVFAGIVIKVYNEKFKLFRMTVIATIAMYAILNIINVDMIIANVNYNRYQKGTDEKLDYTIYQKLSYDAVPYEIKLLDDKNPEMVAGAVNMLESQSERLKGENYSWQVWNYSRYNAAKLIDENKNKINEKKVWLKDKKINVDYLR